MSQEICPEGDWWKVIFLVPGLSGKSNGVIFDNRNHLNFFFNIENTIVIKAFSSTSVLQNMEKSYTTPVSAMLLHFGHFLGQDMTMTSERGLY